MFENEQLEEVEYHVTCQSKKCLRYVIRKYKESTT